MRRTFSGWAGATGGATARPPATAPMNARREITEPRGPDGLRGWRTDASGRFGSRNYHEPFHETAGGAIDGDALGHVVAALPGDGSVEREHARGMAESHVAAGFGRRALVDERALDASGYSEAHGRGERERAMAVGHGDCTPHDVRRVARHVRAIESRVLRRRRHHRHLWRGRAARYAHELGGGDADLFEARAERLVAINGLRRLGARDAEVARAHEDHGDRRVHQGGLDAVDDVARLARGQETPGAGAAGLDEVEGDARARPGHSGQLEVAVHGRLAARHRHARHDELLGVRIVDADQGFTVPWLNEALLDGEGSDGGGTVAAIAGVVHLRLAHLDLAEGVVDVGSGVIRRADDARLRQGRDAAAETVQLAAVGIGAAEGGEEDVVAFNARWGEIALVEDQAAAGASAHVDGSDACLGHFEFSLTLVPPSPCPLPLLGRGDRELSPLGRGH